jgi:plastocyanin
MGFTGEGTRSWWVLIALISLAPNTRAWAQGATISGRVEVLDKQGQARDLDATLVWLEGSGLGGAPPRRVDVLTENKEFLPSMTLVPVGSTVAFPNHDAFDHNVFSSSGPKVFDLGLYGSKDVRSVTFDKPGVARLYCNVHAKMRAHVLVHTTPFASRADKGGRFTFTGVPPGTWVVKAWHERGGERSVNLAVPATEPVTITLDARNYKFVQHLDKNGKSYDARSRRY